VKKSQGLKILIICLAFLLLLVGGIFAGKTIYKEADYRRFLKAMKEPLKLNEESAAILEKYSFAGTEEEKVEELVGYLEDFGTLL